MEIGVKVSVIMPVYNAEKYIGEAIESWAKQTLEEKELICIDDGSTDNSAKVIEKYQRIYENIKMYKQENQGSGVARNFGLQKAKGEYVCFLDADDFYIDENALETIYHAIAKGKKDAGAGMWQMYIDDEIRKDNMLRDMLHSNENATIMYKEIQFDYQYTCFLFSKKLLENYKVTFPNYRRFQDPPFLVKALFYAQEFLIVNVEFYGYRCGHKQVIYTEEKVRDLGLGLLENLAFAKEKHLDKLFRLTIKRINNDYNDVLSQAVRKENLELIRIINKMAEVLEPSENALKIKLETATFEKGNYAGGKFLFPFEKVKKGASIVLYGAGEVGKIFCAQIEHSQYCQIVLWADKDYLNKGENVKNPDNIDKISYDMVVVAIKDSNLAEQIRTDLIKKGVDKDKIVWSNPLLVW